MPSGKGMLNPNRNAKLLLVIRRHPGIYSYSRRSEEDPLGAEIIFRGRRLTTARLFTKYLQSTYSLVLASQLHSLHSLLWIEHS